LEEKSRVAVGFFDGFGEFLTRMGLFLEISGFLAPFFKAEILLGVVISVWPQTSPGKPCFSSQGKP
jgi:hypothetical protein